MRITRRSVLMAAGLLPLTACTSTGAVPPPPAPPPDALRPFIDLERQFDARIGVFALSTDTGDAIAYRADERFAFCSTFKALAAAAVLHQNPLSHLNTRIRYAQSDINSISPVTEQHVATGMTIGELCDAAVRYSDGTAGNLLLADIGGPAGLTSYLRGLGDEVSRMDQPEPELNRDPPGDPRDTTTPRAVGTDYQRIALGDALTTDKRAILVDWLIRNTTGAARIRAAVPGGWTIGNKTGTGDYGRANDIAILWPPNRAPLVLAIMSDRNGGYDAQPSDELIALTARHVLSSMA